MLPLVPSSLLKNKATYKSHIQIDENNGRKKYYLREGHVVTEMLLETHMEGFFDEGLPFSISFSHCRTNGKARVQVKNISVVFGPVYPDGPTVIKESGETVADYKNPKIEFSLTKEEAFSLSPPEDTSGKSIPVQVQISVENTYGNRYYRTPTFDFYERNSDSTLAFLFADGKTMYANLTLLSIHSHYFKNLSEHLDNLPKDEKSGLPLLKLEEYNSHIFENILQLVYPNVDEYPVPRKDIAETLRLADFLTFETVLIQYENWLRKDSSNFFESPCQKLLLSVEYGMTHLQVCVINQLESVEAVEKLRNDPRFNDLPKEIISQVLAKLLEMVTFHAREADEESDEEAD